MRMQDSLKIDLPGSCLIEAVYDYRIDEDNSITVDEIELLIKREIVKRDHGIAVISRKTIRTIRLLDIPAWLWEILTYPETLQELSTDSSNVKTISPEA
jgi:hypothetical protein